MLKKSLIPFAFSTLFLTVNAQANDYLSVDDILKSASEYQKVSNKQEIKRPNVVERDGVANLANARKEGGIIGKTINKNKDTVGAGGESGSNKTSNQQARYNGGIISSKTVDEIDYVGDFGAKRVQGANGTVVGYHNGIPVMCPNPDPLDIHPDIHVVDGETPKISVPVKFRNFNLTLTAVNKKMIKDVVLSENKIKVSYPYDPEAYFDREEVYNLYNEIKRKRAYSYQDIDTIKDQLTIADMKKMEEMGENKFEDFSTGYDFLIQIVDIDESNKRMKVRLDYKVREKVATRTERLNITKNEFKNIDVPVIQERSVSKEFNLPIKNRAEQVIQIDGKNKLIVKFNNYEYDAARVEIDDLEKIEKIQEAKRLRDLKEAEKKKELEMKQKLKVFDELEEAINKM